MINCLGARSGGAVSYLRNAIGRILQAHDPAAGFRIQALCDSGQAEQVDADSDLVLRADTAGLSGTKRSLWEARNLKRLVNEHGFTTVFTPYQVSNAKTSAKSVLMLRNMEPFFHQRYDYSWNTRLRNRILKRLTIRSTKSADHVIAVSEYVRQLLVGPLGLDPDRVSRIYHGRDPFFSESIDDADVKSALRDIGIQNPFLLTCGSLLPYRRVEDVILAYDRLAKRDKRPLDLVIAGDGADNRYKQKLRKLASESESSNQILFAGHVSRRHIRTLYRNAEAVVLATEIEACPNIAIEAMAAGSMIVASDSDPLPEIIGADNARFYEKRNIDELTELLRQLPESPEQSQALRKNARRRADDFCWERCAAATTELLESI